MSLPVENRRSTAALEGIAVLYLMNRFINICSPRNAASLNESFNFMSSHILTRLCALLFKELELFGFSINWVTELKKSSTSSSSLLLALLSPPLKLSLSFEFSAASCRKASSTFFFHALFYCIHSTAVIRFQPYQPELWVKSRGKLALFIIQEWSKPFLYAI